MNDEKRAGRRSGTGKVKTSGLSENNEQTAAATVLLLHQLSTLRRFMAPSMTRIATAYFANMHWGHDLDRSKKLRLPGSKISSLGWLISDFRTAMQTQG